MLGLAPAESEATEENVRNGFECGKDIDDFSIAVFSLKTSKPLFLRATGCKVSSIVLLPASMDQNEAMEGMEEGEDELALGSLGGRGASIVYLTADGALSQLCRPSLLSTSSLPFLASSTVPSLPSLPVDPFSPTSSGSSTVNVRFPPLPFVAPTVASNASLLDTETNIPISLLYKDFMKNIMPKAEPDKADVLGIADIATNIPTEANTSKGLAGNSSEQDLRMREKLNSLRHYSMSLFAPLTGKSLSEGPLKKRKEIPVKELLVEGGEKVHGDEMQADEKDEDKQKSSLRASGKSSKRKKSILVE